MRLKEFDTQLATLQSQLQFATGNIIELSELPLCKQLRAALDADPPQLAGLTRDCVCAALTEIDQTLQAILLLKPTLERAVTVRQSLWMTQETKTHELEQLLSGPSVQLPPVESPLLGRSLTGPAELPRYTSIGELQSRMAKNFESAQRTIRALQAALESNPRRLTRATEDITALETLARDLGLDEVETCKELREKSAALQVWVDSDPLHVCESLNRDLEPALQDARKQLRDLNEERERVTHALAHCQTLLQELTSLQARAAELHAESSKAIQHCTGLRAPVSNERIAALREWLNTLQQHLPRDWQNVRGALRKWNVDVERALALERVAIAANSRPVELYLELCDRFKTLRAKSRAIAANDTLRKIDRAAEQTLKTRPIQLELGAKLVHAYEKALGGVRSAQPARQRK